MKAAVRLRLKEVVTLLGVVDRHLKDADTVVLEHVRRKLLDALATFDPDLEPSQGDS